MSDTQISFHSLVYHSLWLHYALISIAAFVLSWFGVRFLIGYLTSKNIVDNPNERSMHSGSIPRGGGLVVAVLVLLAIGFLAMFDERRPLFIGLAVCFAAWVVLSWCDDRFDLSPKRRLIIQFLIAAMTVWLFGWVNQLWDVQLGFAGAFVSLVGVLWMANLYNFMDGMDGMAASQSIVASITLGIWFHYLGDWQLASVCAVIAASSYGFLLWNWQPARVFMGDVGSVSLGALFATLMIVAANRHGLPIESLLMVFSVFIADATVTLLNRFRRGEKIWLPHRNHFYQRAGLAGIKHAHVVVFYLCLMIICALLATFSLLYRDIILLLIGVQVTLLAMAAFWVVKLEKQT